MLEGRLETFLLRVNFLPTIYFIKRFILYGNVFVNNKIEKHSHYQLRFNEIVTVDRKYFNFVYYFLKSSLKPEPCGLALQKKLKFFKRSIPVKKQSKLILQPKRILLNYPDFMEVDYKLLVAMLIRNPHYSSLTLPVSFNLYTKPLPLDR
jgi:ribosomal protein S4